MGKLAADHMEMSQVEGSAEGAAHIGRVAEKHDWAGIDMVLAGGIVVIRL